MADGAQVSKQIQHQMVVVLAAVVVVQELPTVNSLILDQEVVILVEQLQDHLPQMVGVMMVVVVSDLAQLMVVEVAVELLE